MILRFFKLVVFVSAILLLGQIRVSNQTMAGHFQGQLWRALSASGDQLLHNKYLAQFSAAQTVGNWLHNMTPPRDVQMPKSQRHRLDKEEMEPEEFTSSDRESILRVLQQ